jgi:hypothetical protein
MLERIEEHHGGDSDGSEDLDTHDCWLASKAQAGRVDLTREFTPACIRKANGQSMSRCYALSASIGQE